MKDVFQTKDNISSLSIIPTIEIFGNDNGVKTEFTIAIPTFRRIFTLEDAIESALFQYDIDDYEVIIVDNNPERDDDTELFMRKYSNHPKVSYYKNSQNVGMAGNWNKCAMLSKSDKFVLLHDDDVLSPYALASFKKISDSISGAWSLVKPEIMVFKSKKELVFDKPQTLTMRQLSIWDFSTKCGVGAPTCILYNKESYLEIGGCEDCFFPCCDYINSLNLAIYKDAYIVSGCDLGGYRVANNASLSIQTMDQYFYNNYLINYQVMRHCHLPEIMIKLLLSAFLEDRVKRTLNYYSMHDYQLKGDQFNLYKIPSILKRVIRYGYRKYVSLYDKIFSKYYIVSLQWING